MSILAQPQESGNDAMEGYKTLENARFSDTSSDTSRREALKFLVGLPAAVMGLSGASAKFRPLLADVQSRASCEADVSDVDPTHRDVYARSSRPSPSAPPPRSLSRSRSVVL